MPEEVWNDEVKQGARKLKTLHSSAKAAGSGPRKAIKAGREAMRVIGS